ncbi:MAG TPA: fructose 1,6-bisphosphatase [Chloroflexota bacterium]|jgi:fructose 1,6-bisphosphate aldolase/phosphatase
MLVTLSAIKADVGSIGGHTRPTDRMLEEVKRRVAAATGSLLIDGTVTHTGDDIALLMSHTHGTGANAVHQFAWECFLAATAIAQEEGCYGAGQDLLVDAPSGNVRGAGPGVAEIQFERDPQYADRAAEAFIIFTADKCGPGAYNLPFYLAFCDPMHDGGLLLNPKMHKGFTIQVIDMDYKGEDGAGDRVIRLDVPERVWDVAALLQNIDRFAIEGIWSRYKPDEQIVSVSATRLHNIAGKYTGKDDPIAIVRTQGLFPAPEEVTEPFLVNPFVTGDARGSHVMPLLPLPINSAVNGPYCHPICSAVAFSMMADGHFAKNAVDLFEGFAWDEARRRSQEKALEMRKQGFFGAAMAGVTEIAYTGLIDTHKALEPEFKVRADFENQNGKAELSQGAKTEALAVGRR